MLYMSHLERDVLTHQEEDTDPGIKRSTYFLGIDFCDGYEIPVERWLR